MRKIAYAYQAHKNKNLMTRPQSNPTTNMLPKNITFCSWVLRILQDKSTWHQVRTKAVSNDLLVGQLPHTHILLIHLGNSISIAWCAQTTTTMGHYKKILQFESRTKCTETSNSNYFSYNIVFSVKICISKQKHHSPVTKSNPDDSCFRKTTLFPLNLPASMISTVPGVILALQIGKKN